MKKSTVFDNIFLYIFVALIIAVLITFLMNLGWKGFGVAVIISELVGLGLYAFKVYNSRPDESVKYHSIKECRKFIIDWIRDNDTIEVKPFSEVADSEEGISTYGLPDKRGLLSQVYFGVFFGYSPNRFPQYFFVALNTEIVDNETTFSNKIEKQVFPYNLSSERLDELRYRMCNGKADMPIVIKSRGYTEHIDPMGGRTTNKEESTNADELIDDEDKDVKK